MRETRANKLACAAWHCTWRVGRATMTRGVPVLELMRTLRHVAASMDAVACKNSPSALAMLPHLALAWRPGACHACYRACWSLS